MRYEELLEIISEVVNNDKIRKNGLIMVYELDEVNHRKMDEHLFYKSNSKDVEFVHRKVIDIEVGGFIVRLLKKT